MLYPFFDSTYILIIFGIAVSMIASGFVKRTFNTYNQVKSQNGYTATDAARVILEQSGIHEVRIERVRGDLTDHYD
ncbi:MAG: zinc metallopeptidase, partial [Trichococcus flocculiformis]